MKKLNKQTILGFVAGIILYLLLTYMNQDEPTPVQSSPEATLPTVSETLSPTVHEAKVQRVVDGDTMVVIMDGEEVKVRFSGIDTPESVGDYKDNPEFYGPEASAYTKKLLDGRTVYLEEDVKSYDKYDRFLAYIWLSPPKDEAFYSDCVNAVMIAEGYATWFDDSNNRKYADRFERLEKEAKSEKLGLWQQ